MLHGASFDPADEYGRQGVRVLSIARVHNNSVNQCGLKQVYLRILAVAIIMQTGAVRSCNVLSR